MRSKKITSGNFKQPNLEPKFHDLTHVVAGFGAVEKVHVERLVRVRLGVPEEVVESEECTDDWNSQ